jgi:hypothetical protein
MKSRKKLRVAEIKIPAFGVEEAAFEFLSIELHG